MESSRRFTSSLYVRPERKVSRAHQEIKHARTMQISAARRFSSSRCFFNAGLFQRSGASDQIKPRPPPTSFTRCVPAWLGPWERTRCSASAPQRRYFAQVKWSSARHRAPGPELTLPPRARNSGRRVPPVPAPARPVCNSEVDKGLSPAATSGCVYIFEKVGEKVTLDTVAIFVCLW